MDVDFRLLYGPALRFYEGRRIFVLGAERNSFLIKKDYWEYGDSYIESSPRKTVIGFVIEGATENGSGSSLMGGAFEAFADIASKCIAYQKAGVGDPRISVLSFGSRSLDIIVWALHPYIVETVSLPEELVDQRERIVEAVNAAFAKVTEPR